MKQYVSHLGLTLHCNTNSRNITSRIYRVYHSPSSPHYGIRGIRSHNPHTSQSLLAARLQENYRQSPPYHIEGSQQSSLHLPPITYHAYIYEAAAANMAKKCGLL